MTSPIVSRQTRPLIALLPLARSPDLRVFDSHSVSRPSSHEHPRADYHPLSELSPAMPCSRTSMRCPIADHRPLSLVRQVRSAHISTSLDVSKLVIDRRSAAGTQPRRRSCALASTRTPCVQQRKCFLAARVSDSDRLRQSPARSRTSPVVHGRTSTRCF